MFARTNRCYFIYDRHCGFFQNKLCAMVFLFSSASIPLKLDYSADILSLTNAFQREPIVNIRLPVVQRTFPSYCDHPKYNCIFAMKLSEMQMHYDMEYFKLAQTECSISRSEFWNRGKTVLPELR